MFKATISFVNLLKFIEYSISSSISDLIVSYVNCISSIGNFKFENCSRLVANTLLGENIARLRVESVQFAGEESKMRLTQLLLKRHPNYVDFMTPFFVLDGPKGPSQIKRLNRTRRRDLPVTEEQKDDMRAKLENEFQVMRCLASPYLTKEQEDIWHRNHGHPDELRKKTLEEFEQSRMPGKAKAVSGLPKRDRIRGNVGNLLHQHRTVEDHLGYLIAERRFDG